MAGIQGSCDRRFEAVRDALAASLDTEDVGASAAVFLNGDPVVDIWGGHVDANRTSLAPQHMTVAYRVTTQ